LFFCSADFEESLLKAAPTLRKVGLLVFCNDLVPISAACREDRGEKPHDSSRLREREIKKQLLFLPGAAGFPANGGKEALIS